MLKEGDISNIPPREMRIFKILTARDTVLYSELLASEVQRLRTPCGKSTTPISVFMFLASEGGGSASTQAFWILDRGYPMKNLHFEPNLVILNSIMYPIKNLHFLVKF